MDAGPSLKVRGHSCRSSCKHDVVAVSGNMGPLPGFMVITSVISANMRIYLVPVSDYLFINDGRAAAPMGGRKLIHMHSHARAAIKGLKELTVSRQRGL